MGKPKSLASRIRWHESRLGDVSYQLSELKRKEVSLNVDKRRLEVQLWKLKTEQERGPVQTAETR
jgi:hypothetical protein